MKARRLIAIFAPVACILLILAYGRLVGLGRRPPEATGEFLTTATLKPNEEIIVSRVVGDYGANPRRYYFRNTGEKVEVSVYGASTRWGNEGREYVAKTFLGKFDLNEARIRGLDKTLAYFRAVREDIAASHAAGEYQIESYRDSELIGRELRVGFHLTLDLELLSQMPADADEIEADRAVHQLVVSYGVPRSELMRFFTFEAIDGEVERLAEREGQNPEPGDDWPGIYSLEEWNERIARIRGFDQVSMVVVKDVEWPIRWNSGRLEYQWRHGSGVSERIETLGEKSGDLLQLLEFEPGVGKGFHLCYGLYNLYFLKHGKAVGALHFAHGRYWAPLTGKSQQALNAWLAERGFPTPGALEAEARRRGDEIRMSQFQQRKKVHEPLPPHVVPIDLPWSGVVQPPKPRLVVEEGGRSGPS